MEQIKQIANDMQRIETMFVQAARAMMPALQTFGAALQSVDDAVKRNYEAAGAPYGDTIEGRWQWMHEVTAIAQTRQRARETGLAKSPLQ